MTQEPLNSPSPPSEEPFDIALRVLNEAFKTDPAAVACLIHNQVPCSPSLFQHPTIMVTVNANQREGLLGAYGLLNGVIEAMTKRRISPAVEQVNGKNVLKGFIEIPTD